MMGGLLVVVKDMEEKEWKRCNGSVKMYLWQ